MDEILHRGRFVVVEQFHQNVARPAGKTGDLEIDNRSLQHGQAGRVGDVRARGTDHHRIYPRLIGADVAEIKFRIGRARILVACAIPPLEMPIDNLLRWWRLR